jgi:transposase
MLMAGQASDIASAKGPTAHPAPGFMPLADKSYDASDLRAAVADPQACSNIPPKRNRKDPICFSKRIYRERNLFESIFSTIKQLCRIATRLNATTENAFVGVKRASARIWLPGSETNDQSSLDGISVAGSLTLYLLV